MALEIIAEAAQGYEGNPYQAQLLLKAAVKAGADAVKYQLVFADELATRDYKYYEFFKKLEMTDQVWEHINKSANEAGIKLHFDIFGTRSLQLAERIGIEAVKIHATDINNTGLIHLIEESSVERVLLGAGGAYLNELEEAIEILSSKKVTIMLGFQSYPTPTKANNISRIRFLIDHFGSKYKTCNIGFADHEVQNDYLKYFVPATAIGCGAEVIEKHITLGKIMKLEDHESALNPDEFSVFTEMLRNCYKSIGRVKKTNTFGMSRSENNYRLVTRKHVVANRIIEKGQTITKDDVVMKRTSNQNALTDILKVCQKSAKNVIQTNEAITNDKLE